MSELLGELGGACLYHREGWWTFEVCPRQHVRQFHAERDARTAEYVLGRFDADATARRHADAARPFAEEVAPSGAAQRFHAHVFSNGTQCDLTGQPRSAEGRLVCAPEAAAGAAGAPGAPGALEAPQHAIEAVKEPTTCHYVLTLATPLLCRHAAFRVHAPPVAHIRCQAAPPAAGELQAGGAQAGQAAADGGDEAAAARARTAAEL